MRPILTATLLTVLSGCEPVSFVNRGTLSIAERAKAAEVLRLNSDALNSGDLELLEKTMHPEATASLQGAAEQIERLGPTVGIHGLKLISESAREVVFEYEQTIQVKRGTVPFSGAIVQTKLLKDGPRWAIHSTKLVSVVR
jgi:hypothetical protein